MNGHSLNYENDKLKLTGVTDVKSFEDKEVVIALSSGGLTVRGASLNVEELNKATGALTVSGQVTSLTYTGGGEKGGFMKKLFR